MLGERNYIDVRTSQTSCSHVSIGLTAGLIQLLYSMEMKYKNVIQFLVDKMKFIVPIILTIVLNSHAIWSQKLVDSDKIVKVLTFNILHGATTKGDFNLDVIAQVIIDVEPDFVALRRLTSKQIGLKIMTW